MITPVKDNGLTPFAPTQPVLQTHQRASRIHAHAFARLEELLTEPGQWTKEQRADFDLLSKWIAFGVVTDTVNRVGG